MCHNVNDLEEMLAAGVTITRPARMTRFTRTAAEVIPTLQETDFQFGDLLLFPAIAFAGDDIDNDDVDRRYLLYIYFNSINASQLEASNKNIFSNYKNEYTYLNRQLKIHYRVTNAFTDAVQHYSEIIAEQAARKAQGKPHFMIKLQLHPVDQGFRARFCTLNEHTALLPSFDADHYTAISRRWEYVTVSFRDLSTCFAVKACFGNGMIYTASWRPKEVRAPCDLSKVIAAYQTSTKTIYSCYVIVYRGSSSTASFKEALMPTLPLEWVIDGSVPSTLLPKPAVLTRIHGPVTTFDRVAFTQRVKTLCESETRTSWMTRFKKIVLETDATPRAVVSMGFQKLEKYFLQNVVNPPNLPLRKYQWIEVHKTICNIAIGLAALLPPPYVLLEIIDWLPDCYHSRHVQKINLIMALTTSMRRIQEGRTSRYGRVVRRVYDNKWQKIEK